jgi:hypothetical protein
MFNISAQNNYSVVPLAIIAVMGAMCHGAWVDSF